ncbi:MAG: cytidine deaminase [Acidobacteriota bacterium]|jgi:cytidine deaminase|nr:cytidine deaminase [Bryobacteraceae bacterium CoA2 C42]MCA2965780.1 cytidine deaminase [Acidobacteriaceae bacterium]
MTELARQAMAARRQAFAPYSGFLVGAAVETTDGAIYTGCNIENASYGLTVCAERVAIWKAISEGVPPGAFRAIAIAADSPHPTPPCGACRQILAEFAPQATVTLINLQGVTREFTVAELLPESFNASYLR